MSTFRASMVAMVGFFLCEAEHVLYVTFPGWFWLTLGIAIVGAVVLVCGCVAIWRAGHTVGEYDGFVCGKGHGVVEGRELGQAFGRIEGFAEGKDIGFKLGAGQAIEQDQLHEGTWTVLYFSANPCLVLVQRGLEGTGEVRLVSVTNSRYILEHKKCVLAQKKSDGHVYFNPAV